MFQLLIAVLLLASAPVSRSAVPVDTPLWRLEGEWVYPPKEVGDAGRTAPAAILEFRSNGEFIEHHCWVIEDRDKSLTVSGGDPHVVIVGIWHQQGRVVEARRVRIARTVRVVGGQDPLCSEPLLKFAIGVQAVSGDIGEGGSGAYTAVKRFACPDFDAYVNEAKQSGVACGGAV